MAIGQLTKVNNNVSPIVTTGFNLKYHKTAIISTADDNDETSIENYYTTALCITLDQVGATYYTGLNIDRMVTDNLNNDYNLRYDIWLAHYEPGQDEYVSSVSLIQQLKNDVEVNSVKSTESENTHCYIDLVYTVNTNKVNCLYIELVTRACDYLYTTHGQGNIIPGEGGLNPRLDWLKYNCQVNHYIVNNLLNNNITAEKIGVQSRPGQLIVVNKYPIRIGRSGIYEVNDGYLKVKYFSIIPSAGVQKIYQILQLIMFTKKEMKM